jgi:predicted DNA binding protein
MRKITLDIEFNDAARKAQRATFEHIEYYRVLEVLKLDYAEGLYVDLIECKTRGNASIRDLKSIGNMEILSVLRSEGDKHLCLVKGRESKKDTASLREADTNLIFTTPSMISEERAIVSFIGSERDISTFVKLTKAKVGRVTSLSLKKAVYERKDVLSALTDKQKEVLMAAHRNGYYDIPRRISSERLSRKVGLSKPTLLEHLRKAERRMVGAILEGSLEHASA